MAEIFRQSSTILPRKPARPVLPVSRAPRLLEGHRRWAPRYRRRRSRQRLTKFRSAADGRLCARVWFLAATGGLPLLTERPRAVWMGQRGARVHRGEVGSARSAKIAHAPPLSLPQSAGVGFLKEQQRISAMYRSCCRPCRMLVFTRADAPSRGSPAPCPASPRRRLRRARPRVANVPTKQLP